MAVTLGWPCWVGVVAEDLDTQRRFYRDVLDQAAQAQCAGRGPLRGLLVGQAASGMTQEVPLPGQRLQQIRTFSSHRFRCRHDIAFLLTHRETKPYSQGRTQPRAQSPTKAAH